MYIPTHNNVESNEARLALVQENSLGTIITFGENGLIANHFPFVADYDEQTKEIKTLRAHFSRKNYQAEDFATGKELLVVFKAAYDEYITPQWYKETKPTSGKVVPTWDFAAVHIYGTPKVTDDEDFVKKQMDDLTGVNEAKEEKQWKVSDAPEPYLRLKRKAIHGLEITVTRIEGKWKLHQDKKGEDYDGYIEGLKSRGGPAAEMAEMALKAKETNNFAV
ncbi:hypothetical protein TRVA0_023S01684 [Trichomonascus vanleenenianus]|uniref:uncharacterized protein n=1 Tax=Trichomonascus vanleenenianus TaxID=2268995 RepID=UPI003ECA3706